MGMPVTEFLRRHTSQELTELMAAGQLEPPLADRIELSVGILASLIANQNLKKGRSPIKASRFIPQYKEHARRKHFGAKKQSAAELKQMVLSLHAAFGKKE